MAAGRLVVPGYMPALDLNGAPVGGARLYVYQNNTTVPAVVYTASNLVTPISNPIIADAGGQFPAAWADDANLYSVAVVDSAGAAFGSPFAFDDLQPSVAVAEAAESVVAAAAAAAAASASASAAATSAATASTVLSGALLKDNNLDDVTDVATARVNLSLGSAALLASDTDTALAANSDSRIATQKAVKAAISTAVAAIGRIAPVALTTTSGGGNLTLSGEQTIDGTLTSATRVLVRHQTDTTQNGVYVTAAGAWARATDADAANELIGAQILVTGGSTNAGKVYATDQAAITVGSTAITFTQVQGGTAYSAGTGLNLAGSTFSTLYGTTSGTAAQGNDSRITGAMQKSANGSDIASAATFRSNLGLLSAALASLDTDGTAAANSDTAVASQKAMRTYVASHAGLPVFDVTGFGAVGGPLSTLTVASLPNDDTAIHNAVAAAVSAGGGIVYFPPNKVFRLDTTIQIQTSNVFIMGGGKGALVGPGIDGTRQSGTTRLMWGGASGGTMIELSTPVGGNMRHGGGISRIMLDANNLASYGIYWKTWAWARYEDIFVINCKNGGAGYRLSQQTSVLAGSAADVLCCTFINCDYYAGTDTTNTSHGFLLQGGFCTTQTGNTSGCVFMRCEANCCRGSGCYMEDTDDNLFMDCDFANLTGIGSPGLVVGSADQNTAPSPPVSRDGSRFNIFILSAGFCGTGTPGMATVVKASQTGQQGAIGNVFYGFSRAGGNPDVVIETGSGGPAATVDAQATVFDTNGLYKMQANGGFYVGSTVAGAKAASKVAGGYPMVVAGSSTGHHIQFCQPDGTKVWSLSGETTGGFRIQGNDTGDTNIILDADGLSHVCNKLGLFSTPPVGKQTVTGSRGGNAALASLLTALANYGLITNSSSA